MVVAIVLAVLGFISYIFLNVVIRRMVAVVRSREDYDEDVDGKMTDAEKKAFEETKEIEAGKTKIGFADVKAEYKTRFFITAIIGAVLGALVGFFFGVLTVIAFIDMDTMEIPPSLNLIILGLGIISLILNLIGVQKSDVSIIDRLIGAVCVSGFLLIVTILVKGAFGGGDIKLMAAAGVLLGWKGVLTGFLIGLFIGAAIGIVLIARRKKGGKEHMPFGPSLCIGLVLAVLFGQQLVNWYIDLLKSMMPNTYGY